MRLNPLTNRKILNYTRADTGYHLHPASYLTDPLHEVSFASRSSQGRLCRLPFAGEATASSPPGCPAVYTAQQRFLLVMKGGPAPGVGAHEAAGHSVRERGGAAGEAYRLPVAMMEMLGPYACRYLATNYWQAYGPASPKPAAGDIPCPPRAALLDGERLRMSYAPFPICGWSGQNIKLLCVCTLKDMLLAELSYQCSRAPERLFLPASKVVLAVLLKLHLRDIISYSEIYLLSN